MSSRFYDKSSMNMLVMKLPPLSQAVFHAPELSVCPPFPFFSDAVSFALSNLSNNH